MLISNYVSFNIIICLCFFHLTHFRELGQKYKNIFVRFLVQMETLNFALEINWPLVMPLLVLLQSSIDIIYRISTWACSSFYLWEISKQCAILQNTSIFRHISSLGSLLLTYNIWDGPIHLTLFQEWAAACRCYSLYPPWSNITQKL